MNIDLHIERLVVDAGALSREQIDRLAATLEVELVQQLRQTRNGLRTNGEGSAADGRGMKIVDDRSAAGQISRTIAASVMAQIGAAR